MNCNVNMYMYALTIRIGNNLKSVWQLKSRNLTVIYIYVYGCCLCYKTFVRKQKEIKYS